VIPRVNLYGNSRNLLAPKLYAHSDCEIHVIWICWMERLVIVKGPMVHAQVDILLTGPAALDSFVGAVV